MIVYVQTVGGSILDPVRSSIEVFIDNNLTKKRKIVIVYK